MPEAKPASPSRARPRSPSASGSSEESEPEQRAKESEEEEEPSKSSTSSSSSSSSESSSSSSNESSSSDENDADEDEVKVKAEKVDGVKVEKDAISRTDPIVKVSKVEEEMPARPDAEPKKKLKPSWKQPDETDEKKRWVGIFYTIQRLNCARVVFSHQIKLASLVFNA